MLGTMLAILGGFAWMVLRSYRQASREGSDFQAEGKRRWTEEP
jgi:hypothetical protein